MQLFTSKQEKRYWLCALLVLLAIITTLFFGRPLLRFLDDQNLQAAFFLLGMFLTAVAIVAYGLKLKPGKMEMTIWLGLAAVYTMLFLRLGLTERSHLIEYSVLAIFIHMALGERNKPRQNLLNTVLPAFIITFIIGALDEFAQKFIPDRVFDPEDILFNGIAAFFAILSVVVLQWIRSKMTGKKE